MELLYLLVLLVFLFLWWRNNPERNGRLDLRDDKGDREISHREERWERIKKSGIPIDRLAMHYEENGIVPSEACLTRHEFHYELIGSVRSPYRNISATEYLNQYAGKTWGEILAEVTGGATLVEGKQTWEVVEDKDAKQDLGKMLACCKAELAGMEATGQQPAPYYFERAAILFRKAKLYEKEIQICEFYIELITQYCDLAQKYRLSNKQYALMKQGFAESYGVRIEKAKILLEKQQQKKLKGSKTTKKKKSAG